MRGRDFATNPEKGNTLAADNKSKQHFETDTSSTQLQAWSSAPGVTAAAVQNINHVELLLLPRIVLRTILSGTPTKCSVS